MNTLLLNVAGSVVGEGGGTGEAPQPSPHAASAALDDSITKGLQREMKNKA